MASAHDPGPPPIPPDRDWKSAAPIESPAQAIETADYARDIPRMRGQKLVHAAFASGKVEVLDWEDAKKRLRKQFE